MLFFNVASLKYKHHESIQMIIDRIDHLVLTVSDISTTIRFYEEVLGFSAVTFKQNRKALIFGAQKLTSISKKWSSNQKRVDQRRDLPIYVLLHRHR